MACGMCHRMRGKSIVYVRANLAAAACGSAATCGALKTVGCRITTIISKVRSRGDTMMAMARPVNTNGVSGTSREVTCMNR